jgi:DNA (cytosine-5)-methyltransferase 3A
MENVASMKPAEKNKISLTLGEFYANDLLAMYCEPVRINSSLVSAQMRDRLYWCNWNVNQPKDKGILLQDVLEQGGEALNEKSYALLANYGVGYSGNREHELVGIQQGGMFTDNNHAVTNSEKSLALTANYGKMNAKNFEKGQGQLVSIALKDKAPCVSTDTGGFTNYSKQHGYAETQALIVDLPQSLFEHDKNGAELIKIGNIKNDSISCRVYSPEGKAATQNANGGGQGCRTGLYKIGENVRKLTPRECCRLQTYDERVFDFFSTEKSPQKRSLPYMSKSSFYNVFGDSFTVDVIVHILQCNREMIWKVE